MTEIGGDSALFVIALRISSQRPQQQAFSVLDPSISFPQSPSDTISVGVPEVDLPSR